MMRLKCKYNNISVKASRMREREGARERETETETGREREREREREFVRVCKERVKFASLLFELHWILETVLRHQMFL